MKTVKRYIPLFAGYIFIFILAQLFHYIFWGRVFFFLINSFIMSGLIIFWAFSNGIYTPDKTMGLLRLKIGILMLFWYFCKCCHDRFLMESNSLTRLSWYGYYVAIIFLPVLCYEFSLHFGANVGEKYKKRTTVLYIIAATLAGLVITNDFHELAFYFPDGISNRNDDYSHGIVYFISVAFAFILLFLTVFNVLKQCTLPHSKRYIWLPLFPLAVLLVYIVLYLSDLDFRLPDLISGTVNVRIFAMVDVLCILLIIFIEACGLVYRIATELPDEQSFILHKIRTEIEEKSDKAYSLIDVSDCMDNEEYKQNLYYAGFIQTFNKRLSNLLLLGSQNGKLDFSELSLSLAESVEFLKLNGTTAMLFTEGKGKFSVDEIISVYREFEERTEKILPHIGAVMVVLSAKAGKLDIRISAEDKEGNEL